jgi:hypothetical protein
VNRSVVLSFALALGACGGRVEASPPSGEGQTSADGADVPGPAGPCGTCLANGCLDLLVQCEGSPACADAFACAASPDGPCECTDSVTGNAAYAALSRCLNEGGCQDACGQALAACTPAPSVTESTAGCEACVSSACAPLVSACQPGSDCVLYAACAAGCSGSGCDACGAASTPGALAAAALDVCVGTDCEASCGY